MALTTGSRRIPTLTGFTARLTALTSRMVITLVVASALGHSGWALPFGGTAAEDTPPWPVGAASSGRIFEMRLHYVGNIWMAISNSGQFGGGRFGVNQKVLC